MKLRLFILFFVLMQVHTLLAVDRLPYTVTSIGEDSGIQTEEIRRLFQDKEGFLWIGATDGIYKYDGYKATTLYAPGNPAKLLITSMVHCFAEGADHTLWIGTDHGLVRHHKDSGESEYITDFRNHNVASIAMDKENCLWVGTDKGLWSYHPLTGKTQYHPYEVGATQLKSIQHLIVDSTGKLWIACWNVGLYRFDPHSGAFESLPQVGKSNSPHHLMEDRQGRLWIGTWGDGLFYCQVKQAVDQIEYVQIPLKTPHSNGLQSNIIFTLEQDSQYGYIWVGGREGLNVLCDPSNPESYIHISEGSSRRKGDICGNNVNDIMMCSSTHRVWLGILGGGIECLELKEPLFRSIDLPAYQQQYGRLRINKLIPVGGEKLWISIPRKNILEVEMGSDDFQFVHTKLGMPTAEITGIYNWSKLASGEFIFSSYDGRIFKLWFTPDGELIRFLECPSRIMWITSFSKWNESVLWTTSKDVGFIREDGSLKYVNYKFVSNPDPNVIISDLCVDTSGDIWVSTRYHGIYRMRISSDMATMDEIKYYPFTSSHGEQIGVNKLFFDGYQQLWVGTNGEGLFCLNKEKDCIESVSKQILLPQGIHVFDLIEDVNRYLWLDTDKGLFSFSLQKDGTIGAANFYDVADGLLYLRSSNRSFALTNKGILAFGTRGGVNYLPAMHSVPEKKRLFLVITNMTLHNRDLMALDKTERERILHVGGDKKKVLRLRHNENNLSIEFAALGSDRPKQLSYAYKLEGLDNDWVVVSSKNRKAIYNYLRPGKYTFKVRVSEDHLTWNEEKILADVIVSPVWWNSVWGYLLYALCLSVIGFYAYRFFLYRNRLKQEVVIKELEKRSVEEVSQIKLQFFTNISHELMTPLTIISTSLEGLKRKFKSDDSGFAIATANVERLLRLFEQILEFRKAETRNLKLKVNCGDIASYVEQLSNKSFRLLAVQKNIHYSMVASPNQIRGYFDEDKLGKILFNLISNAIKFTSSLGTIQLTLQLLPETNEVEFHVHDTGIGIETEQLPHIFLRFYDGAYRKVKASGHGIGLSLTKELVELHHGHISVESKVNVGTDFRFVVPISKEAYSEEEIDLVSEDTVDETENMNLDEAADDASSTDVSKQTLLLVEDNQDLLITMANLLRENYEVRLASQGEEAMVVLEEQRIDVVLSDILMPVMDGITLCKRLKEDVRYSHIPVVLLTAQNTVEDKIKGYEAGADGYIGKPFNLTELLSKVHSLLVNKTRLYDQLKQKDAVEGTPEAIETLDERFLRQVVVYIEENLSNEELDMDALASAMCVSRSVLYRKIKSLSGDSPINFVRQIRLNTASRLLRNETLSIADIAFNVGIPNTKYFSTLFKKEYGMSPTEYAGLQKVKKA